MRVSDKVSDEVLIDDLAGARRMAFVHATKPVRYWDKVISAICGAVAAALVLASLCLVLRLFS